MRVLYNTCVADPWVKVAQRLRDDYGYEPVYWIGFNYDDSENIVKELLPTACYQSNSNAWRGIFSKEIADKAKECYVDIDFLKEIAVYELQAIKMMDRLDYDRYSFNYMERERHFLNLLKSWMACIEIYKPDLVVSAVNPHRVYDYVLYLLCKRMNIKFITFQYSMCVERIYATTNFYTVGDLFEKDYKYYLSKKELDKNELPVEILNQFEKVLKDYSEAAPAYMKTHPLMDKKYRNFFFLVKTFVKKYDFFGKNGILRKGYVSVTMFKNRKYSLEKSHFGIIEIALKKEKNLAYSKRMHRYYSSLAEYPQKNVDYILLPLHYQPEATTSPAGDIFVNQRLCVEMLLKYTSDNYFIYVKEHPQQFMSHMLGHTNRIKEFYDDLIVNPRVKLMPFELDSYSLMRNAKAVATVTGTVGWEAMMHRKPVIVFGMIWYEQCRSVLRVTDETSASKIMSYIENYCYDEHDILAYLMAFAKNSIRAYHYQGRKEKMNLPEEECVHNIIGKLLFFQG